MRALRTCPARAWLGAPAQATDTSPRASPRPRARLPAGRKNFIPGAWPPLPRASLLHAPMWRGRGRARDPFLPCGQRRAGLGAAPPACHPHWHFTWSLGGRRAPPRNLCQPAYNGTARANPTQNFTLHQVAAGRPALALAAAARRCGAGPPRRSATWSPSCLRRPLVRARPTLLSTAPQRCAGAPPPPPVATPWETLGWSLGAAAGAVSRLHDSARHASLLLAALRPRPCRRRRCRRLYAFLGLSSPALPARPTVPCGGLQPLLPLGPGNSYSTLVHAMYGRPACSCGRLANPEGAHPPAQPRASRPACSC